MLLIIFLTQSSTVTIAEYISNEVVNYGVVIKIESKQETVKTGEVQNVTVRSSYANPNDEKYEKVRIYLWEYAEDFLDNYQKEDYKKIPNKIAEILNLEDNKMVFSLLDNQDLTVVVTYVETETEKYLEFEMPPGTSCNMEMEFRVPNGITDDVGLILEPKIINEDGEPATNNHIDKPKCVFWESDFGWENLQKSVNFENVSINKDNSLGQDLVYSFSGNTLNNKGFGDIWTKEIIFKDIIDIPNMVLLENLVVERNEEGNFTGKIIDLDDNEIFKFTINDRYEYNINTLEIKENQIIIEVLIKNPNVNEENVLTSEFNPLNDIIIDLNSSKIKVSDEFISDGTEKIHNSVVCKFIPYVSNQEIVLESLADTTLDKDIIDYNMIKTANKTKAIYGDTINYNVDITNNGRNKLTREFFDVLSDGIYFNDSMIEELKEQGFDVGHVELIHEDTTENSGEVSFASDNYWDSENGLQATYSVNKEVSLHDGVRLIFDVSVPNENNVNGKLVPYIALQMGNNSDDWSGWIDTSTGISFDNAIIKDNKKVVTVSINVPSDCISYSYLQAISIQIFGSGSDYSGEVNVSNVKLYDGPIEVSNSEIITYQNKEQEIKSDNVSYDSENSWDSEKFNWEVNLNGVKNELDDKTTVTFDLSIDNVTLSGKIIPMIVLQTEEDWSGWLQSQKVLTNSDFKVNGDKKTANVSVVMPSELVNQNILQKFIIKIVGSLTGYSGNITIGNIKLSTGKNMPNNYIRKEITVEGFSKETISYSGTIGTMEEGTASNNAFFGNDSGYIEDDVSVKIDERNSDGVENTNSNLSLNKYIEGRAINGVQTNSDYITVNSHNYTDSLNVLGPGDVIYYTVELKNDGTEDETVNLEDYSPLTGNYNFYNGTYMRYLNSYSYNPRGFTMNSNYYLKMYGLDQTYTNFNPEGKINLYKDFVDSQTLTNINNTGEIYSFTLTIPAGETYKQTFILQLPTDTNKSDSNITEYEKWEILMRQNLTAGNAYSGNDPRNYNKFVWDDSNTPANTIVIKDTKVGAMVYHKLRRNYQINKFVAGEELRNQEWGNTYLALHGNYYKNNVHDISTSTEQFVIYGVTLINDSSEILDMSKTHVIDTIPSSMDFVGTMQMNSTSYYGGREEEDENGIKFSYVGNVSYGTTEAHYGSKMIKIMDNNDTSGNYTGNYLFSQSKKDPIGVRGYNKNGNTVEFLFDTGNFMKPYSYTVFYYVCRMKGSGSTDIENKVNWDFSELMNNMIPSDFGMSDFNVQYSETPQGYSSGYSDILGKCKKESTNFNISSTVYQKASSVVKANIYKSVVGNNNYEDVIGEGDKTAKLNYYSKNMNEFFLDENNVVTFCLAVANDTVGISPSFTVNDSLPKGFEFLGVHTITEDYDIYEGTANRIKYEYENNAGIKGESYTGETLTVGAQEHYLSPLITNSGSSISGAILNGYNRSHESLVTTNRDHTSQGQSYQSGGYYYFSTSGNYEQGQRLSFNIYQSGRNVTYIIYSCRVHPEYFVKDQIVKNSASLSGNYMYWNGMKFAPFYNSDLSSVRISEKNQNICKGIYKGSELPKDQICYSNMVEAYCNLKAVERKSANIQKTVFAAYDKDDISKGEAYYETSDHQSVRKSSDGTNLGTLIQSGRGSNVNVPSKSILHQDANVLTYSPIDGIHATQDYRSSVIWKVTVENDGKAKYNAANLIEKIDNPFKLYGYTIVLKNKEGNIIGAFYQDYKGVREPDTTVSEYTSKVTGKSVTRNVYNINLINDLNESVSDESITGEKNDIINALEEFSEGYSYEIYFYTDMVEEYLDWYYDTTILKLDEIDTFNFTSNPSIESDVGIRNDDWVSVIASDGIKYIEKYDDEDEKDVNSKRDIIHTDSCYELEAGDKEVNFTLEVGSYLYQTQNYKDGQLDNIIVYDLLPGIKTGGIGKNEVGGGYTINTDSFNAYILRTDGTKEPIEKFKYKVMYSLEDLHGGRHPDPIYDTNDTVYNVDFTKAKQEEIWQKEYNKDCRSLRIVFDGSVELKNADRLYVDYSVTIRDDALEYLEYHNVFGYIYDCISTKGIEKTHRLYEDTVDVSVLPEQPQEITFKKLLYDMSDNVLTEMEEVFDKEFTFRIYSANDNMTTYYNKLGEFNLKPNQKITISEIEEQIGKKLDTNKTYYITESTNSYTQLKDTKAYIRGKEVKENVKADNKSYYKGFYFKYLENEKPMMIYFNNEITSRGVIEIYKRDENDRSISFNGDASVAYQILDENGKALKFTKNSNSINNFYYDEYGGNDIVEVGIYYCYIRNLPLEKTYTIKEVKAPNNYQLTDETVEVTCDNTNTKVVYIKNTKLNNPVNLTINKIDSETKETISTGETTFVARENSLSSSDMFNFIDLNIKDEKGHHYRIANEEDSEDNIVNELTTFNSKIYIENIGEIDYMYFFEISSAFGYGNFSTSYIGRYSKYNDGGDTVTEASININNTKSVNDMMIYKKDINDNSLLNNVEYEILLNDEKMKFVKVDNELHSYLDTEYVIPVYKMVPPNYTGEDAITNISAENGIIKIKDVPQYVNNVKNPFDIKEIKAPEGYQIEEELIDLVSTTNILDKPDNGYVKLIKKDDKDNIFVEPVAFEIYNENDEKVYFNFKQQNEEKGNIYEYSKENENAVSEIETKDGKIFINKLPLGNYKLKETKPVDGFILENEYVEFSVDYTNTLNDPLALDVINVHSTGNVVFTKVNTNEETILETATFNILNSDDELLKFTKQEDVYIPDENGTPDVSTTEGKISINNLPLGTYKLVETVAPETYKAGEITEFKVKGENYYEPAQINVVNKHAYGDVNITKLDVNGEVIESDVVTFKIYDENNNVVNFELNNEEENKTYEYNVNGTHSRISTSKGKLSLKKLPIGKYYLEELIAPQGYTLLEDKLEFEVTDAEFTTPLDFAVVNPDYIFGSEEYVSSSFEKIEEKDLPSNNGYGYFGKESDYEIGNKNYIYVDAKEDTVRYTLRIGNMSKQNFENVVLINKLPDIGDTGVINLNKERDSEFTVKLANNPNYEIYLIDNNQEIVESPAYTIEYTDEIAYTESDWNGDTNDRWYQEPRESTKAFRIKFAEGFILPSLYGIEFRFDGTIQDNAEPGKIAWDSFGYRYYVNGTQLSPEPPKVGVKIPYEPLLTKIVEDDVDGEFEFEIFEKDPVEGEKLVHTLKVKSGETANLELKKIVNGVESGYLEQDKDYIIREKTTKQFKEVHVEGINGKAYSLTEGGAFEFEYDKGTLVDVTFTNAERKLGEVSLEKFDLKTGEKLPGAEFELRDSDGTALNVEKVEDHYVYRKDKNENTTTKLYTNDEGKINVKELPYGDYVLYETKQPDGYLYGTKHDYKFTINDDAFDLKANGEVVVKPIKIDVYNEPTQIMLEKYYDEEIHGVKYDGSIDGALLQIWDKDKKVMYSEITTDGLGSLDVSRLPIGEYVLVEEIAPKGFKKADDIYFKISEDGKLIIDEKEVEDKTVKMKDEALLGKIILNKKAEVIKDIGVFEVIGGLLQRLFSWITGTLKDVSFEIYASEDIYIQDKLVFEKDKLIDTITTNDLGVAILEDIPVGNYYAVEVKTGDDYELEKIPISLKLEYDDTDQEIVCEKTIVNERKIAKINIHKTDSKDKNIPVENAVFGLYSAEKQGIFKKDELVLIAITNSEGIATFGENLPVGKYYIKEIQAPEGYYKSKERIDFEFKDTDEFNFEFVNEKKPVEEKPVVPNVTVVNNNVTNNYIYGTSSTSGSNGAVASSGERTPNTGDLLPIIVSYIMSITLIANIAQIIISKKKKK